MYDPPVRLVNLPVTVHGFCYHDDDGETYIVLNARDTREQNLKTYEHERNHIRNDDLFNMCYTEYP